MNAIITGLGLYTSSINNLYKNKGKVIADLVVGGFEGGGGVV